MGLKCGMAALAANRGLYVPLKLNDGKPFPLARVIYVRDEKKGTDKEENRRARPVLRYPNGMLGHLMLSSELQLELFYFEWFPWVPTEEECMAMAGTLDPSRIIFEGKHEVRYIADTETV